MTFFHEQAFFEATDGGIVFRTSPFAAGYHVSRDEKDRLFAELGRIEKRTVVEFLVAFAVLASPTLGWLSSGAVVVQWLVVAMGLSLVIVLVRSLSLRDRMVARVLGGRPADIPRPPFWTALWKPRPVVANRYAVPVLRFVNILMVVCLVAGNGLAFTPIVAAMRAAGRAVTPDEVAAVDELLSLTLYNETFWMIVAGFNLVMLAVIALGLFQLRTIRAQGNSR